MIPRTCPHCSSSDIIRFGTNRSGTPRCRCKSEDCKKTFTLSPKSCTVSAEKEAAIGYPSKMGGALAERISQAGIAGYPLGDAQSWKRHDP